MAFTGFNLSGASSIYYGSTPVREVWKGGTKIWPISSPLVGAPTITSIDSGFWGMGSPEDTGYMACVLFDTVQGAISYTCHFGSKEITISKETVDELGYGSTGDFYTYPYSGGQTVDVYMTATNGASTVITPTISHTISTNSHYVGVGLYIRSDGNIEYEATETFDEDIQVRIFISPIRYMDGNGDYQVYRNCDYDTLTVNLRQGTSTGVIANMHTELADFSYVFSGWMAYNHGQVDPSGILFCSTYSNASGGSKWYHRTDSGKVVELTNDMAFESLDQY